MESCYRIICLSRIVIPSVIQTSSGSTNTVLYRELLRRRSIKTVGYSRNVMLANLEEMKGIVNSTGDVKHLSVQLKPLIKSNEKLLKESTSYLLANLHQIEGLDDMKICRKEALNRLSDLVQNRIKTLQNPPDCSRSKLLLADTTGHCGYGCQAHYLMFCLNIAYATGRTLILRSLNRDWAKWWSESYMSFSDNCNMDSVSRDDVIVGRRTLNNLGLGQFDAAHSQKEFRKLLENL
ncbi:unnamed protein product [Calicophoron daubneyi]|uniref:Alpha-(1,6)-fucosyltransferase N- and catalytic domain-containing protein n=1 Tax=Calicophoron daubneyi TaxID=300641 RepID=A0AAV2T494_CALDB